MTVDVEQLQTIRSLALAQLASLHNDPLPSYAVDGEVVAWSAFVQRLERTIEWCGDQLAARRPFEIRSQGTT
ncbi:MAG: hypothetical protein KF847_00490 [Pirellulales bacterium]|nr:hypothetical protein [Pirellulales bacterium]